MLMVMRALLGEKAEIAREDIGCVPVSDNCETMARMEVTSSHSSPTPSTGRSIAIDARDNAHEAVWLPVTDDRVRLATRHGGACESALGCAHAWTNECAGSYAFRLVCRALSPHRVGQTELLEPQRHVAI